MVEKDDKANQRPVALITGGARGIGKAIAKELATNHSIAFTYLHSKTEAKELEGELPGSLTIQCDLNDDAAPDRIIKEVVDRFGRLDVLVNNASMVATGTVETGSLHAYADMMKTNAIVPVAMMRAALPYMKPGSAIVNLSSVNGQIPPVAAGAFGASKAALEAFTIAAAKELGPRGIRVNAIAPGITRVEDVERSEEVLEKYNSLTPLGRIGEAEEVAKAVRFLATDASSYITGECIRVAGGIGH